MIKMTKKKILTPKQKKKHAIISLIYDIITYILLIALYRVIIINSSINLGFLQSPGFVLLLSASITLNLIIRIDIMIEEWNKFNN